MLSSDPGCHLPAVHKNSNPTSKDKINVIIRSTLLDQLLTLLESEEFDLQQQCIGNIAVIAHTLLLQNRLAKGSAPAGPRNRLIIVEPYKQWVRGACSRRRGRYRHADSPMLRKGYQPPFRFPTGITVRPLDVVLITVLRRRQWMPLGGNCLVSTRFASVNPRVRRDCARTMQHVERSVGRLSEKLQVLVHRHFCNSFPFGNA